MKYEVGAESWALVSHRAPRGESPYRVVPIRCRLRYWPAGPGADQRCDGDEDEHCAMIACVEVVVVSFEIVRHVPEPRFTY